MDGLKAIEHPKKEIAAKKTNFITMDRKYGTELPIRIEIIVEKEN